MRQSESTNDDCRDRALCKAQRDYRESLGREQSLL